MKAIVMYASITGNNEEIANFVAEQLKQLNIETQIEDLFEGDYDAADEKDLAIIVPYTYDKGSIPSEMIDFFEDLGDKDWTGKKYWIVGSGDKFYGADFGKAIDRFEEQITKTGATEIAESLKIHTRLNDEDKKNIHEILTSTLK
jgi:flavodoxin short chain